MRIPLTGGAYQARSVIADAQRCVNLYPERNPPDAPVPYTHYQAPGLDLLVAGTGNPARCTYRASNGDFYFVAGSTVYHVDQGFALHPLGTINPGATPVVMADNGLAIVVVDGSTDGWAIDMASRSFGIIPQGGAFYGGVRVDYVDTYFLLNRPGTNQWYISLSNATYTMLTQLYGSITGGSFSGGGGYQDGTYDNIPLTGGSGSGASADITVSGGIVTAVTLADAGVNYAIGDSLTGAFGVGTGFTYGVDSIGGAFDPLDIATKDGYPDPIQALIVMHREVWLIGQSTSEIWYDSGASDFAFQAMPGAFVEHGTIAPYSVAAQDLSVYFLSQDKQGRIIAMRGSQYQALRISTHAIENEWMQYSAVSDAIGFTYQQEGHAFWFLTFPTANKTWVFDQATELWHERAWTDGDGNLNRHRANCSANVYGRNVAGDWQTGALYAFDLETFTDAGSPMSFIRTFPHLVGDGNRASYARFTADIEVGSAADPSDNPVISLRWSDDRGVTYGNRLEQGMGNTGQYLSQPQWRRLGMARDRVFELSWSSAAKTALNGAWIDATQAET